MPRITTPKEISPGNRKQHACLALCRLGIPAWPYLRQGAQCRCGIPPGACSCVPPKNGRLTGEILFRWLTARPGNLMSGRSPVKARTTAVQVNRSSDVLPPSVNGGRIRNRQCSRRAFRNHGSASNCVELRAQIHWPRHIPRPPLFGKNVLVMMVGIMMIMRSTAETLHVRSAPVSRRHNLMDAMPRIQRRSSPTFAEQH